MKIRGIPSSPGKALGTSVVLSERSIPVTAQIHRDAIAGEIARFEAGLEIAGDYYRSTRDKVVAEIGAEEGEIFDGYLELLFSDDVKDGVREAVTDQLMAAEAAALSFCEETARDFDDLEDEYFRQRADDIRDLGKRLAEAIHYGGIQDPSALAEGSIVAARELAPALTVRLDITCIAGIITETGGPTSHAAILARSMSIPCITGAEGLLEKLDGGIRCLLDGDSGELETGISDENAVQLLESIKKQDAEREELRAWSRNTTARLADGTVVTVKSNVSNAEDARKAAEAGATGSGLVRTEFIYMSYDNFPTVDQQTEYYKSICEALSPHPVTIRLLDCGADKPLAYANQSVEDNPFLGERGIRFLAARPNILEDQITAIARVHAMGHPVKAMIPMVISSDEIQLVRNIAGKISPDLPVGIMIETPASVLNARRLAADSDFFSIGTNDLVQYLLAVDRGNAAISGLYREFHPAVMSAIATVVEAADEAGIPLGVCGDMASRKDTALALLAMGIRELSASSSAVPEIKQLVCSTDGAFLKDLKSKLLSGKSHGENAGLVQKLLEDGV